MNSFEWVALAEAQKVSEELIDQFWEELSTTFPESKLPIDEEELLSLIFDIEEKYHKRLCLQQQKHLNELSPFSSVKF